MRVRRLLGVVSLGTMFATAATWAGCGGTSTSSVDGGGGSAGSSGTKGTSGTAGTKGTGGSTGSGGSAGGGGGAGAAGGAGSGGSGGTSGEGGTPDSGPPKEGGTVMGPNCPTTPCTGGMVCCADVTAKDAGDALSCKTSCASDDTLGCSTPADCASGSVCCVTAVLGAGTFPDCVSSVSSACVTSCPSAESLACSTTEIVQACTTDKDCTDKAYPACCTITFGGTPYSGCLVNEAKLDPSLKCM
jgi:hypothetical protein